MKLIRPIEPYIETQSFERHEALAAENGWCSKPGPCPSKVYYYGGWDAVSSPPIGAPVRASAGEVDRIEDQGETGYGLHVRIKTAEGYTLIYAHLSKVVPGLKAGQMVTDGQIIGYTGHSGNCWPEGEVGAHVHFETRDPKGIPIDPEPLFADGALNPVKPVKLPEVKPGDMLTLTGNYNLRINPSLDASIAGILPEGMKFKAGRVSGDWVEVLGLWVNKAGVV